MVSAVVLAAGKSERMGKPKLFLPFRGKPVLQWVLDAVLASNVHDVVCVTRDPTAAREHLRVADERLYWLVNDRADAGQSSSVIAGLWGIDPRSEGALFVAGDQPMLNADLINALIERFVGNTAPIVAPAYQGQARNPVLFRRQIFPELLALRGDRGGRTVIDKHSLQLELVQWQDEAPFIDIDDPDDYERLIRLA